MSKGFDFNLTVNAIDVITPRLSGESEIDGTEVVWGYAVKFSTRSTITVDDKDFGEKDEEVTLEIEVPCSTKAEVKNINEFLRKWRDEPIPFYCDINLPKYSNKVYKSKSKLKGIDFINFFNLVDGKK